MPTPSRHTYHYGEHNPLKDPDSGIRTVSHDGHHGQPQGAGSAGERAGTAWDLVRHKAEEWMSGLGSMTQEAWNTMEGLAGRSPLVTLGVGLAVGFLTGQCLVHRKSA